MSAVMYARPDAPVSPTAKRPSEPAYRTGAGLGQHTLCLYAGRASGAKKRTVHRGGDYTRRP